MPKRENISMSVIRRLPRYYRFLKLLGEKGVTRISSTELSAKLGLTARGIAHDNTHDNAIFMAGCKVMGCRIFMSSMMGNFIKSGKAGKMHMSINDFHSYHLLG